MTPGERIREKRKQLGLTMEQVAVTAGVSTSTVSRIERNAPHQPGKAVLTKIAQRLGLEVDDLVAREGVAS